MLLFKKAKEESGSVLIIVSVLMVALLGFAGLAVDTGYAFLEKARMQALADAMALGCAQHGCEDDLNGSGVNSVFFAPLESPFDMKQTLVKVDSAAICQGHDSDEFECIEIQIHKEWNTFFLRMLGHPTMSLNVASYAVGGSSPEPEPILGLAPSVMALGPGGNGIEVTRQNADAGYALSGVIVSNSTQGIRANTGWEMPNAEISGEIYTMGSGLPNFNVKSGTKIQTIPSNQPIDNPCPTSLPPSAPPFCNWNSIPCQSVPSCTQNNQVVKVPSGSYGNFQIVQSSARRGCVFELSGVYTLMSNFEISLNGSDATVNASGATFITKTISAINLNIAGSGGHEVNLQAPLSGDFAGMLIWHTGHSQSLFLNYGNSLIGSLLKSVGAVRMDGVHYVPDGRLLVQKEGGGLFGGSALRPTETQFSGLIAKEVSMNVYSRPTVQVQQPTMSGICNENGDGTHPGGGSDGGSGRSGKSRLVH